MFLEKIYSFKVFNEYFCKKLIEEIQNFENTDLPKGCPNSMNNYGVKIMLIKFYCLEFYLEEDFFLKVLLNELGFDDFFNKFRENYLSEFCKKIYPTHS